MGSLFIGLCILLAAWIVRPNRTQDWVANQFRKVMDFFTKKEKEED
jgi:hypothetical protein